MKILTLLGLAISLIFTADAGEKRKLPFEPAYAADQEFISFESLEQEYDQFQELSDWMSILAELDEKKEDDENLKSNYERGKKLVEGNHISRQEFARREFDYRLNATKIAALEQRAEQARCKAEIAKIAVLQLGGNSQTDVRKQIAHKMHESLEHQIKALQHVLAGAQLSKAFYGERLEEARRLLEGGHISLVTFEKIEDDFEEAETAKKSAHGQMEILQNSIEGLEKSKKRLFKKDEGKRPSKAMLK